MKRKKGTGNRPGEAKPPAPAEGAGSAPRATRKARVSSPVELAATLRTAAHPEIEPAPAAAAAGGRQSLPIAVAATFGPSQDIEEYAVVLHRRLEARAPVVAEEDGESMGDTRALRDRLRDGRGYADLLMFRIGHELFAADLASVEEAVELPEIHRLPEMPEAMLGAFDLRGRLTPVYSPAHVIGIPLSGSGTAALLVRANGQRIGLAVDDVEDVLRVDLATVRGAPGVDATDGVLLGVVHHGGLLVALLDATSLVAGCVTGTAMESA